MTIWILGVVLVAGLGALGRQIGSIRMGVSMIGAIISYVATIYLVPIVAPMMDTVGIRNPITVFWLTPCVVYVALFLLMNALAQGVYMKVNLFFQYRAKEDAKMRFERMDTNVGLALGIANGCVLLSIISVPIYIAGYITVQFQTDDDPFLYGVMSKARTDLSSTGFDKIAAALAPDTSELFKKTDTIATIYHNADVQEFLAEYPQFYVLTEEKTIWEKEGEEITSTADGAEVAKFASLITGKAGMGKIVGHPYGVSLMDNSDFMFLVEDIDFADLDQFIETGETTRYGEEPHVGKWEINLNRSFRDFGQKYPRDIRASYLTRMPIYGQSFKDIELTLAPDGVAYLKCSAGGMVSFAGLYSMIANRMAPPRAKRGSLKTIATGSWSAKDDNTLTLSLEGKNVKVKGDAKIKSGFLNWVNQQGRVENPIVMHRKR
ncbi:MAG: hypothetical protein ACPGVU_01120 [Limisphaerales bacterium]